MRTKSQIIKEYLLLLNEEKGWNYSDEKIKTLLSSPDEIEGLKKLIDEELYSTEEMIINDPHFGKLKLMVNTERAFYIFCKCVVYQDVRSGRYIWNSFVKKQFLIVERNKQSCYMAHRGSGKSFFMGLYVAFKMYLIDYYDVCYCSNVPKQKRRWMRIFRSIIDVNELLLEKKDVKGVASKGTPWGQEEIEYNFGILEGTTVGTTPRGGHYNLAIGDDPLREDKKYTDEFIVDYFQGTLKPTTYTKKARYIVVGCVTPDTKIITEKGIEEIGDQIKYNPEKKGLIDFKKKVYGKDGWDMTSKFYVNGKTKTKKIILDSGYEIECSTIHPLWTCLSQRKNVKDIIKKDCQWVKSAELKVGDKIAIKVGTRVFGKTSTIAKDLAYFYGLFTAEGCVDTSGRANRIIISNQDPYCVNFIKDRWNFISQDNCHHRKNSKELVSKMKNYGVSFERCHLKRVPKKIMLEPKEIQVAFLQGLYDGDGHCTISNDYLQVVLTSTSKKQLLDVQSMLLNFGMIPSLHKSKHKGHYKKDGSYIKESESYTLTCSGKNAILFLKEIGFRIKRKNRDVTNVKYVNLQEHFGFIWKKIKKIEDSENYTVDFVIPKNHSFITNGIVSHNTPQHNEDLFHTLMNDKLDKNNRPLGRLLSNGQTSAAGFYSEVFPSIIDEKNKIVLVPEIWTYEELMVEKGRIGDIRFNREMMCRCITYRNSLISSSLFKSCCDEKLQLIQKGEEGRKYIIIVDSATSDAPTADYCAMSVFEDTGKNLIFRNLFHEKGFPITDPDGLDDDQIHKLYNYWKSFNNALIVIERNNAGIALIQGMKALCAKNNESADIIEHFTHTISTGRVSQKPGKAEDVIDYIEHGLKAGFVIFPCDPDDIYTIDAYEKIKIEHLNFGVKKGKSGEVYEAIAGHDDIFDTCYLGWKFRGNQADTLPMAITLPGGI